MRRLVRVLLLALVALTLAAAAGAVWARAQLRGSLPQLEGERQLGGLSAPVRITRDDLGIPTIRGATRVVLTAGDPRFDVLADSSSVITASRPSEVPDERRPVILAAPRIVAVRG